MAPIIGDWPQDGDDGTTTQINNNMSNDKYTIILILLSPDVGERRGTFVSAKHEDYFNN